MLDYYCSLLSCQASYSSSSALSLQYLGIPGAIPSHHQPSSYHPCSSSPGGLSEQGCGCIRAYAKPALAAPSRTVRTSSPHSSALSSSSSEAVERRIQAESRGPYAQSFSSFAMDPSTCLHRARSALPSDESYSFPRLFALLLL